MVSLIIRLDAHTVVSFPSQPFSDGYAERTGYAWATRVVQAS